MRENESLPLPKIGWSCKSGIHFRSSSFTAILHHDQTTLQISLPRAYYR